MYYIRETMRNKSNHQLLGEVLYSGSMPVTKVLEIACGLTERLHEIHALPAIHGNINPSSIIYDSDSGKVWFSNPDQDYTLQRTKAVLDIASIPYISPEQTGRMNRSIDYRCDFYSLGVILYQLFSGKLPLIADDPLEFIHAHLATLPVPLAQLNSSIPLMCSQIVMKLLAKNAEDRYQSAFGIRHDLERCQQDLQRTGHIDEFPLATKDFSEKLQIPQKLYGREKEIKHLINAFNQVSEADSGLMLVAGYSGTGKSSLVQEVHKAIVEKRGYFIEGKFDQYQRDIPYHAWGQAFSSLVNHLLMESESKLAAWKEQILNAVGTNGKVLTNLIPNLEQSID